MQELYRSETVVVRCIPCDDLSRWVVTFDNYGLGPGFDRVGFGEVFLQSQGISAIHVLGRGNDWYQYPDMAEALATVRDAVASADRVMTYGSSMGGYAAVRFAQPVGATSVLAFSPQYSLDPRKIAHDPRWKEDARRIEWREDVDGPIQSSIRPVVIYDSTGLDGWHGDRIAQDIGITAIKLPLTAHPVAVYLDEIGMLRALVLDTLDGSIDPPAVEREARRRRRASANYFGELARRQPLSRAATALALARRAVELGPTNGHALSSLAALLSREGLHDESLDCHARLLAITGPKPDYLIPYGDALFAAGRQEDASEVARQVSAMAPHMARFQLWAGNMLWRCGATEEAVSLVEAAAAHNPGEETLTARIRSWRLAPPPGPTVIGRGLWARIRRWGARVRRNGL